MTDAAPVPPPLAESSEAKKGLSVLAWIAIGVGTFLVVGFAGCMALGVFVFRTGQEVVREATGSESLGDFVDGLRDDPARTAAEALIRLNPELDLISTDEAAGSITFRNKRTNEEATLNFEDIAEGRFSMTTAEGELSIDAAENADGTASVTLRGPDGETRLGGSASLADVPGWVPVYPRGSVTQSAFQTTSGETRSGVISSTTTDPARTVVDYFKGVLEDAGYAISAESLTQAGTGAIAAVSGELDAEGRSITVAAVEQPGETQVMVTYTERP